MTDDHIAQIANEHFLDCNQLTRHQFINFGRAIEAECQKVPEGYVLVPVEKLQQWADKCCKWHSGRIEDEICEMLAAAPKPAEPDHPEQHLEMVEPCSKCGSTTPGIHLYHEPDDEPAEHERNQASTGCNRALEKTNPPRSYR